MNNKNTENVTEAAEAAKKVEIVGINFRDAGKIYYFSPGKIKFNEGDRVIVDTARGTEMGTVKIANKSVSCVPLFPLFTT